MAIEGLLHRRKMLADRGLRSVQSYGLVWNLRRYPDDESLTHVAEALFFRPDPVLVLSGSHSSADQVSTRSQQADCIWKRVLVKLFSGRKYEGDGIASVLRREDAIQGTPDFGAVVDRL